MKLLVFYYSFLMDYIKGITCGFNCKIQYNNVKAKFETKAMSNTIDIIIMNVIVE